ncbi:MAG: glycosyltransferase family 2 protein [Pseudomonadota bacterium]
MTQITPIGWNGGNAAPLAGIKPVKLSVVIPCYNEEPGLDELCRRVVAICEATVETSFEVILIDDGSKDRTRAMIAEWHGKDPRIVGVFLSRNHGHQLALTAGLHVARGDRIFILDADLQDPPELLPDMMSLMNEGNDVVYGQRQSRSGETHFKKATAAAFYRLFRQLVDVDVPLDAGDFRLISRKALNVLLSMPEQHRFVRGMVSWIGFKQAPLLYARDPRFAGETKYPLRKMVRFAIDAITGFSIIPLRIATWIGLMFAAIAAPLAAWIVFSWARGETIEGWSSLTLMILIVGAAQLVMTGILGEYVGRIFVQMKGRPLFVIDQVLREESDAASKKSPTEEMTDAIEHAFSSRAAAGGQS